MTRSPSPEESARLLRQRLEMGGGDLFLDDMSREEALRIARAARAARAAPGEAGVEGVAGARPTGPTTARSAGTRPTEAEAPRRSRPPESPAPDDPVAPGGGVTGTQREDTPPLELPDDYDALRALALECTRCRLCEGRTQVVFSDGSPTARLMVVGEAPGANEDETGLPFVGAAGKYLDLLLSTVGLSRTDSVYIANVLKCRPPGNRDPLPDEIEACSPFLHRQIELVRPDVLLAVGSFSAKLLTGQQKAALGKLRGEVHSYRGVPLVVTYHPAALLRNPRWTRAFWTDLQLLREVMERDPSA